MIPLNSLNHIPSGETCDDRPLVYGGAIDFDGVDGIVDFDTQPQETTDNIGLSITLNADSLANNKFLFRSGYFVFLSSNGTNIIGNSIYLNPNDITNQGISAGDIFEIHIFNYRDGSDIKVKLYINSTEIAFLTNDETDFNRPFETLGYNTNKTDRTFNGKIYQAVNYKYPNTFTNYTSLISSYNSNDFDTLRPYIIRQYNLEEMNGTTVFDSSGNDIHGTLEGGASYVNTTEFSFRDNYGYSDGTGTYAGVYIPRDESNIKFDVLGDSLQYKLPSCNLPI